MTHKFMKKNNQEIEAILAKLKEAHKNSEKFYAIDVISTDNKKPKDIFDMALAFENEKKLLLEFQLALSKKFPEQYSESHVSDLREERKKLTERIKAWKKREFPK